MTQIFIDFKKTLSSVHFWSIFPLFFLFFFFFFLYPALPRTTSDGFLAPCQNLEKTNDTIPRKRLNGRTDRPSFIGSFRLPPEIENRESFMTRKICYPTAKMLIEVKNLFKNTYIFNIATF